MKKLLLSAFCLLAASATSLWADNITFSPLQYELLPDMQTPRRGHVCFATADGDIVAVGGHTTGFKLTSTAERLHNGQWESVSISNPHDGAGYVTLPDGRVIICGGFSSGSGVGQSKPCDVYDPATNTFTTTGSLNTARGFVTVVSTGVGNNVLASGNWYANDNTFELWNGETWTAFGEKTVPLNHPFMVSDGQGIVYVFGCRNNYSRLVPITVWRVNTNDQTAEVVTETGLEAYEEVCHGDYFSFQTSDSRIFLMAKKKDETTLRLISFSAITGKATELAELPAAIPDVTDKIDYVPGIMVNEARKEAYIMGYYGKNLVVLNYALETGKMTVFYGGPFEGNPSWGMWALQPTTNKIIFTGGSVSGNFDPITTCIAVTPYAKKEGSPELQYTFNETDKTATVVYKKVQKTIDEYHITYVNGYQGDIVIPEEVNGYTVTAIDDNAFMNDWGTDELTISSIDIPNTIKKIGKFAFYNCNLLKKLTIPASVETIGEQIIAGSAVQELTVEDSEQPLNFYVVSNDMSLLAYGEQCTKVYLGRNIRINSEYGEGTGGYGPFTLAGALTDLTYGPQVSWLHKYECWSAENLQRVTFLTDKVKELPESAFGECTNLSSIQLPSKLERIERTGIFGSQKLKTITLPATLRYVGGQGLDNPNLETIYAQPTTPPATEEAYVYFDSDVLSNCKLYVPKGSGEAYKNAPIWKDFQNIIEEERLGINAVKQSSTNSNNFYTLDGRRMVNPTQKDIYINNGKKIVIR